MSLDTKTFTRQFQIINTKSERTYHDNSIPPRPPSVERAASPVHVVQRTWESRNREEHRNGTSRHNGTRSSDHHQQQHHHHQQQHLSRRRDSPERTRSRPRTPESRSVSPSPARRDKKEEHSRPSKCECLKERVGAKWLRCEKSLVKVTIGIGKLPFGLVKLM